MNLDDLPRGQIRAVIVNELGSHLIGNLCNPCLAGYDIRLGAAATLGGF